MSGFASHQGRLFAEEVDIGAVAEEIGTPFYCYSSAVLTRNYRAFSSAFPDALIAYSVKANGNLGVLKTLAKHNRLDDALFVIDSESTKEALERAIKTPDAGVALSSLHYVQSKADTRSERDRIYRKLTRLR